MDGREREGTVTCKTLINKTSIITFTVSSQNTVNREYLVKKIYAIIFHIK